LQARKSPARVIGGIAASTNSFFEDDLWTNSGCTALRLHASQLRFRGRTFFRKEILMRIPALAILTIAMVLTAAPARAQTYGPDYPVCLHLHGDEEGFIECGYTSLAQCAQSASGRAAQCVINPYFASAHVPGAERHYRRHRRVY
jgi:hypothetical protein